MCPAPPHRRIPPSTGVALRRLSLPTAVAATAVAAVLLTGCQTNSTAGSPTVPPPPATATTTAAATPDPAATPPSAPSAPSSPRPSAATARSKAASPAADATIAVTIADGKVSPNAEDVKVKQGQTVRVTIRSDVDESIHVHGYDKTAKASPGEPGEVTFTADVKGVFEIETHESAKLAAKLIVS